MPTEGGGASMYAVLGATGKVGGAAVRELRRRGLPVRRSAEHMGGWRGAIRIAGKGGVVPLFHQPLTKVLPTVSAPDVGEIAADILAGSPGDRGAMRVVHVEGPRRYTIAAIVETIA